MADDLKLVYEISADNRRLVGVFSDSKKRLTDLEAAARDATAKVGQAARELTRNPGSPELQANLAQLKTEAASAKREFLSAREGTERLRREMAAAGLDTRNLAESLQRAKAAQAALNAEQAKASAVGNARQTLGVRPFAEIEQEIGRVRSAFNVLRDSGTLSQAELAQAADRARLRVRALSEQFNGARALADRYAAALNVASRIMAGLAALSTGSRVLRIADEMQLLLARLALVEGGADGARKALAAISGIAQRTGIDIGAVGESYIRFARVVHSLGGSSLEAQQFTEALALALKVSGASAEESAGVMRQLSQAMQKGKLNGDEFITVAESGGQVLDYLATALGVSRGKLLEMSTAGTLTADKLLKLNTQLGQIRKDAAALPETVGAAAAKVTSSFKLWAEQSALVAAASKAVTTVLNLLADNMTVVLALLGGGALAAGVSNFARLAAVVLRFRAVLGLVAGINPWIRAFQILAIVAPLAAEGVAALWRRANPPGEAAQLAQRLTNAAVAVKSVGTAAQQAGADLTKLYDDLVKKGDDAATRSKASQDALQANLQSQLDAQLGAVDAHYQARLRSVLNATRDESAAALQTVALLRQAEADKLVAVDTWARSATAAVKRHYDAQRALAAASGQDTTAIAREALSAQLDVLGKREAAYRRTVDSLIGEEQRLLEAARRTALEREGFSASLADRIRALQQRGLTDVQAYEDRNKQIAEKTAAARAALASGDTERAKKLAEDAMRIAESNAREVTQRVQQGGKEVTQVVVTEAQAAQNAIAQVAQAGTLVDAALRQQEINFRQAAAAAGQGAQAAQGTLAELRQQIADLQRSANIKITADVEIDQARVDGIAEKLRAILQAKDLALKIAVDAAALEQQIKLAADKVAAGGGLPVQLVPKVEGVLAKVDELRELAKVRGIELPAALKDSDARRQIDELRKDLSTPTTAAHQVTTNLDQVNAQIDALKQPTSSTHTVYVQKVEKFSTGGLAGSLVGVVRKLRTGGALGGYGGGDRIPAMLEPGEFVLRKEAVRAIGASTLARINSQMALPGGAMAAATRRAALSSSGGSGGNSGGGQLDLRLLGPQGQEARVTSERDDALRLVRLLRSVGVKLQ
ncbi:MAG: tape measure protein [Ramlibacter sp.]|nr:tape measure protein [Ramlibacter sp.]